MHLLTSALERQGCLGYNPLFTAHGPYFIFSVAVKFRKAISPRTTSSNNLPSSIGVCWGVGSNGFMGSACWPVCSKEGIIPVNLHVLELVGSHCLLFSKLLLDCLQAQSPK